MHRYLGQAPCTEVVVVKIYPDTRCLLEDGSVINRFTKSYYHSVEDCPVPKLVKKDTEGKLVINFPVAAEVRRNPSTSKPDKEPYITERLSNGQFRCNCPWRTYHPADECRHIKEWKLELASSPS